MLLQGAVAAGMKVVVVPSLVESQDEAFKLTPPEEAGSSSSAGGEREVVWAVKEAHAWLLIELWAAKLLTGSQLGD